MATGAKRDLVPFVPLGPGDVAELEALVGSVVGRPIWDSYELCLKEILKQTTPSNPRPCIIVMDTAESPDSQAEAVSFTQRVCQHWRAFERIARWTRRGHNCNPFDGYLYLPEVIEPRLTPAKMLCECYAHLAAKTIEYLTPSPPRHEFNAPLFVVPDYATVDQIVDLVQKEAQWTMRHEIARLTAGTPVVVNASVAKYVQKKQFFIEYVTTEDVAELGRGTLHEDSYDMVTLNTTMISRMNV